LDSCTIKVQALLRGDGKIIPKMTAKNIKRELDISLASTYRALDRLINNGLIDRISSERIHYFSWKKLI